MGLDSGRFRRRRARLGETASVGAGTYLVFLLGVAAAAAGAGILIQQSAFLGAKGTEAVRAATENVAGGNVEILQVLGERREGRSLILRETARTGPGTDEVDLRGVVLKLSRGDVQATLTYSETLGNGTFTATVLRDEDSSFAAASPLMNRGDLVEIQIDLTANGLAEGSRSELVQTIIPEGGQQVRRVLAGPTEPLGPIGIVRLSSVDPVPKFP
ncbi:MAG: hypothetical protein ACT4PT_09930 [Methanobacteriota archaeon]